MFRTVPPSIIRSFLLYIQQWYMSDVRPDAARKLSANLYDIYHCCVYTEKLLMMDGELSETCRVLFQKLVHLVGFIIRI